MHPFIAKIIKIASFSDNHCVSKKSKMSTNEAERENVENQQHSKHHQDVECSNDSINWSSHGVIVESVHNQSMIQFLHFLMPSSPIYIQWGELSESMQTETNTEKENTYSSSPGRCSSNHPRSVQINKDREISGNIIIQK